MVNTDERSKRVKVVKRKKLKVKRAIGFFTVLIMLLGLIPVISITRAANATLEVKGSFVNLRTGPGTNYDKSGVVIKADQLEQLGKQGDWYKVKTKDGKVAWIAAWLVAPVKTPLLGPTPVSTGNKVVLKGSYANLRSGPGTTYNKVGTAQKGQELDHVKSEQGWEQVRLPNGRLAWVAGWLVTLKTVPVVVEPAKTTGQDVSATGRATVTGTYVNVRHQPNTNSTVVAKASKGEAITVLGSDEFNWYRIKTTQGKEGWVAGWLIKLSEAPGQPVVGTERIVVSGEYVNVRQQPTTSAPIITKVYKGQGYAIKAKEQDWYKIDISGQEGWVAGWLVQVDKPVQSDTSNDKVKDTETGTSTKAPDQESSSNKNEIRATIGGSNVKLRAAASSEAEVVTLLARNQLVKVLGTKDDWTEIVTEQEQTGYVASWLVKPVTPTTTQANNKGSVVVLDEAIEIRADKAIAYESINSEANKSFTIKMSNIEFAQQGQLISNWPALEKATIETDSKTGLTSLVILLKEELGLAVKANPEGNLLTIAASAIPQGVVVVLDAGHGGIDPGAVGPSGLKEKEVAWAITSGVKERLEAKGVTVLLTRQDDTKIPLNQRAELANREQAQLFVSIHCNANSNRSVRGTSTYTYAPQSLPDLYQMREERLDFAKEVQKQLVAALGLNDQGVKEANFAVLRGTKMPSILVETAYISNYEEEKLLANKNVQNKAADGISAGILSYLQID